jgi:polyisoprenoid-binding protein YceI
MNRKRVNTPIRITNHKEHDMKKLLIALTVSAAALTATAANADAYKIDPTHAFINFKIQHLGYSWLNGRFNDFSGDFTWDPAKQENSTVTVTIKTESVDTNFAERNKHLRSGDFLNVEKFPTATFKSTSFKPTASGEGELTGEFTLHGITKTITFPVHQVGEGKDPWGGYRAGFSGIASITLGQYGMDGYLGDLPVELELNIEGIRQ